MPSDGVNGCSKTAPALIGPADRLITSAISVTDAPLMAGVAIGFGSSTSVWPGAFTARFTGAAPADTL